MGQMTHDEWIAMAAADVLASKDKSPSMDLVLPAQPTATPRHAVRVLPTDAAGIVRDAITASGGLGEPWSVVDMDCPDDLNAVRVGDLLFGIEVDDLGWLVTAYVIADDEAAAVTVLAGDTGNPTRALTALLRDAAGPMAWRRVAPGQYRCGRYVVGQLDTGEWFAEGPGVDRCFDHKHDAQAACAAARSRTAPAAG